jgi:hypothetical protein
MALPAEFAFLAHIGIDLDQFSLVTSSDVHSGLRTVERLFHPPVATELAALLQGWQHQRSRLMFETVPEILNPGVSSHELNPTGRTMEELFPDFCQILEQTDQIGILLPHGTTTRVILFGSANQFAPPGWKWSYSPEGKRPWTFYLPQPLAALNHVESDQQLHLSPQMRQWYVHCGGAVNVSVCPDIAAFHMLKRGSLWTDTYEVIMDQVTLGDDVIKHLQSFVVLSENGTGNADGYFPGDLGRTDEYVIHTWDHETAQFSPWVENFAALVRYVLTGHRAV